MNAGILLCAGFGTRLKPATDWIPKPAIPFLTKPMVEYAIEAMRRAHIEICAANVHHLSARMETTLRRLFDEKNMTPVKIYREQGEILGTGGGARECAKLLKDADRFVIYHGDVLCSVDLDWAMRDHIASGCDVSLVLVPRPKSTKLGMIGVDAHHRVAQIRDWKRPDLEDNAPLIPACFAGIHIVERRVLETMNPEGYACLVTEIYRQRLEAGKDIHAIMTEAFFADIGTPETYFEAQDRVVKDRSLRVWSGISPNSCTENLVFQSWKDLCDHVQSLAQAESTQK